ncbi:MAG: tRNA uridine-5-carboxymethylaminomethyl(34) synthesis GTPase MnmE [Flavobacteriaceae bacterium]|nr:tRNA uridine-5-carboxymethylaminomethyl(34) synthesis GTPase MnmE [Flavobacteriaceae bacterium]
MNSLYNDTIIAIASPPGIGAIAVIRLSGPEAITICNSFFKSVKGTKDLSTQKSHTLHFGYIKEGERLIDEVLVSLFHGPNSYTGENTIEISCHGSSYIQQEIVQLFLRNQVRLATPGEFTLRAFLNGKLDLSQAEAVADLIESNSAASHQVAMQQMRGGYSKDIEDLRQELLNFASLMELELDFSEEDVEFADRNEFKMLVDKISRVLQQLIDSFALGNVLKNGIPIAIVGEPNVGKSTLLNALLKEEKAIVSEIPGTTRDAIEDEIVINGIVYRFIDTAGIRETKDVIETIGIQKTFEKIQQAHVIIYLLDAGTLNQEKSRLLQIEIAKIQEQFPSKLLIIIANKIDLTDVKRVKQLLPFQNVHFISAKNREGIHELTLKLTSLVQTGKLSSNNIILSNSRHYEAFSNALKALNEVKEGINNEIPTDLLAIDIRQALYHLGEVTGQISTDDLLGNIFANFCIGK